MPDRISLPSEGFAFLLLQAKPGARCPKRRYRAYLLRLSPEISINRIMLIIAVNADAT
jgi:hypothetical protein